MTTPEPSTLFPPIDWVYKRLYEIPFASAVAANTQLTILSDALTFPFQILEAKMFFDTDHINNVRYYFKYSSNRTLGTTAPPPDPNICSPLVSQVYFVGNGFMRKARTNLKVVDLPAYLKVHIDNTNAWAIQANASILLTEI